MKWIKYQIEQSVIDEQPVLVEKKVGYTEANLAIAQAEAYNGYEIVDDGKTHVGPTSLVVLEGTKSVVITEDVTIGTFSVPYPQGFTKDNCTILSIVAKDMGYNNLGDYTKFILSSAETIAILKDTGVEVQFMGEPRTHSVSYRIALFKYK